MTPNLRLLTKTIHILLLVSCGSAAVADTTIRSSDVSTNLIELYTSEGCSSCPRADNWLNNLKNHPGLWSQVIPLAFHVDYWDYIGWQDPFAEPRYSERQRRYADENGMRTIYTPGLMSNGKEWRNFSWNEPSIPETRTSGSLVADIGAHDISVRYQADQIPEGKNNLIVNTALLGFGLKSDVMAGENDGREFTHDFVVLAYEKTSLRLVGKTFRAEIERPQVNVNADRYAVAVWVSSNDQQAPLQAIGGWLN